MQASEQQSRPHSHCRSFSVQASVAPVSKPHVIECGKYPFVFGPTLSFTPLKLSVCS